jgi:hypothetical protein
MGMNRSVVDEIGMFDEETFGRGYGEEEDWCVRANEAGYENVIVPNLFVSHRHGGSFSPEEKTTLITENSAKLFNKHPEHLKRIWEYIEGDPLKTVRDFLIVLISSNMDEAGPDLVVHVENNFDSSLSEYAEHIRNEKFHDSDKMFLLCRDKRGEKYRLFYWYKNYKIAYTLQKIPEIQNLFHFVHVRRIHIEEMGSHRERNELISQIRSCERKFHVRITCSSHCEQIYRNRV